MGGYPARGTAPFWSGPLATFCHLLCRHVGRGRKGASVCLLIAHQACARCFRHMTSFSPPRLFLMLSEAMTAFSRIKKKGWGDLLSSLHSAAGPGMCRVGWLCSNRQHESDSRSPSNPPPIHATFPASTQEGEAAASAHPKELCWERKENLEGEWPGSWFSSPSGRGLGWVVSGPSCHVWVFDRGGRTSETQRPHGDLSQAVSKDSDTHYPLPFLLSAAVLWATNSKKGQPRKTQAVGMFLFYRTRGLGGGGPRAKWGLQPGSAPGAQGA